MSNFDHLRQERWRGYRDGVCIGLAIGFVIGAAAVIILVSQFGR